MPLPQPPTPRHPHPRERETETERQTDRDRQRDRQRDRERQTDRQIDRDRDIERQRQRHRDVERDNQRDMQTDRDREKALIAEVAGFVCGSKEIHRTASSGSVTGKEWARSTLDDGTPAHQQLTAADWSILFRRTTPSRIACARAEREHGPCPRGH